MSTEKKYLVLISGQSCLKQLPHKLNAQDTFNELKNAIAHLIQSEEKLKIKLMTSDFHSCRKMLKVTKYYLDVFLAKKSAFSKKAKVRQKMPFNFTNEVLNAFQKHSMIIIVHHFKVKELLKELDLAIIEPEPKKEQIFILEMTERETIFSSRVIEKQETEFA